MRGIIFDLDGTLVDSRLDFETMRREMGLPQGVPILEALAGAPDGPDRIRMLEVMRQHELRGANEAVLFDGVIEFLNHAADQRICCAVLTRNSRESTDITLARLKLNFSRIVTREDAPPKPDPTGVRMIIDGWRLTPSEVIVIGDYVFDLQAGRQAGARSILFAPDELPHFHDQADFVLRHFRDASALLGQLQADHP